MTGKAPLVMEILSNFKYASGTRKKQAATSWV
jgi:hypothetical protein